VSGRFEVFTRLKTLRQQCVDENQPERLIARLDADLAYLRSLMGERLPFEDYVRTTQGCGVAGWPEEYVLARRSIAQ
jgi:hypothetical protein